MRTPLRLRETIGSGIENGVFLARALDNAMQRARKDCKKITWRQYSNQFICSMPPLSVLLFLIIEQIVLMVLVFYEKCMLDKVTMQRTPQFADFSCYRKNPAKCSACVVSLKMLNSFLGNTPISREPPVRI